MKVRSPAAEARRSRPSRAQKSEAIRRALFLAAARVVGDHGYAEASIARITERAEVAHGTFYNYFASRQDLFDQLLPELGRLLLAHVTAEAALAPDPISREQKRLEAWFSFLGRHPEFYRILNEAEVFVPEVFKSHVETLGTGYVRALKRAQDGGLLQHFTPDELEPIAYILLAARSYLTLRFSEPDDRGHVPASVTSAYLKLLTHGLFGQQRGGEAAAKAVPEERARKQRGRRRSPPSSGSLSEAS